MKRIAIATASAAALATGVAVLVAAPAIADGPEKHSSGRIGGGWFEISAEKERNGFDLDADLDNVAAGSTWKLVVRHDGQRISRQVLREYMAVVSRPQSFSTPLGSTTLIERMKQFEASFHVADDTASVTSKLLELLQAHTVQGKQIHDANIAATMLAYGVTCLLTANVKDFRRFESRISIQPLTSPEQ